MYVIICYVTITVTDFINFNVVNAFLEFVKIVNFKIVLQSFVIPTQKLCKEIISPDYDEQKLISNLIGNVMFAFDDGYFMTTQ